MRREKSCGFVAFKEEDGERLYLLIRSQRGEYGFPKGHTEPGETELETAERELKEETNVEVERVDGFRLQIEYMIPRRETVLKEAVYFLGRCKEGDIVCQEEEVSEAAFLRFEDALKLLPFENTRGVLREAEGFLRRL